MHCKKIERPSGLEDPPGQASKNTYREDKDIISRECPICKGVIW